MQKWVVSIQEQSQVSTTTVVDGLESRDKC